MIRAATHADIPELLPLMRRFHVEANWSDWCDFDEPSMQTSLDCWLAAPSWRFLVFADPSISGFICGAITPLYCNHSISVAQELLWWVDPMCRDGRGEELLCAFHEGCDFGIQTVSATIPRADVVQRKLRMTGWSPIENNYIKRLGQCV